MRAQAAVDGGPGVGWVLGFARYRGDRLDWYRAFSLALRPSCSFSRAGTSWQRRRAATALEEVVLFDRSWIVTIKDRFTGHEHNLAMDLDNVMGLMAWIESAPPGSHYLPGSADSPFERRWRFGASRSVPGTHRTSPSGPAAVRHILNSRSLSRFR